jgi:16S rRNA U1498 N3-methylase RsmE
MNEYRSNLADFYNTLLVLKELYNVNIITKDEFHHLEGVMRVKYGIKDISVFSLNTVAI